MFLVPEVIEILFSTCMGGLNCFHPNSHYRFFSLVQKYKHILHFQRKSATFTGFLKRFRISSCSYKHSFSQWSHFVVWMHIFCFSWHKINVTIEPSCTAVWHSLIKQSAQDCSRSHTQTQSQQLSAGSRSAEGCPTECGHSPTNMAELIPKYNPTHKRLAALATDRARNLLRAFIKKPTKKQVPHLQSCKCETLEKCVCT